MGGGRKGDRKHILFITFNVIPIPASFRIDAGKTFLILPHFYGRVRQNGIKEQLAKAGVRVAWMQNEIFKQ
jgi:hypothetical protein